MKKRALLIAMTVMVIIAACIKEKKNVTPATTDNDNNNDTPVVVQPIDTSKPQPSAKTIQIKGLEDFQLEVFGSRYLKMQVECDSCFGEQITLEVTGAPKNVELSLTNSKGPVGFTTTLSSKSWFGKPGTYPVQIVATSEKGKKSTYNVNMIIKAASVLRCNDLFEWATSYNGIAMYTIKSKNGVPVDTLVGNLGKGVYRSNTEANLYLYVVPKTYNINSYGYVLSTNALFSFDCETSESTIPLQILQGKHNGSPTHFKYFTVQGQGKLNIPNNTYDIIYTSTYDDSGSTVTEEFLVELALKEL